MFFIKEITKKRNKWAIFSLFFCILAIFSFIFVSNVQATINNPISSPPDDNAAGLLNISDISQAKSGSLRLGTNDITPPFNYQLEVLGLGADFSNSEIVNDLQVWNNSTQSKPTLSVDSDNSKVCIGPCLNIANSKLEVSNTGVKANNSSGLGRGLSAFSNSEEAIYGSGVYAGIQGLATTSNNYGIYAFSAAGVALEGVNLSEPKSYSSVAGISDSGYGIYGTNNNNLGLWSAYFNGRVESNVDVSATKFLSTRPTNSLVPYTSGQVINKYFKTYSPNSLVADNNFIWVGQSGFLVDGVWQGQEVLRLNKATGKILDEYNLGSTSALVFDATNNYIWQAASTYSGRVGRIGTSNFVDESRTIIDADGWGTCPMSSLVLDPIDSNILWVLQAGGTCFSRSYNDRLLKFEITGVNGYTTDPNNWNPLVRYEILHSEGSPQTPTAIINDGTNLWLSFQSNDKVYKINPADPGAGDNNIDPADYASYAVPGPTDLVYDSSRGYIWASASDDNSANNGAYHINISSGIVSSRIITNTGPIGPMGIAYDGSNIYVGTTNSSPTGYVDKIDPGTDTVVGQYSTGTSRTVDVIVDSGVIWTANWYAKELTRLDATDGRQLDVFSYGNSSLAVKYFDGTYLWITKNGELLKVRASDGFQVMETTQSINAVDVIDDGNYIWATVDDGTDAIVGDKISKINKVTGIEECFLSVSNPSGIIFTGFGYWVASNDVANNQGNLLKINGTDCTQLGSAINLTVIPDFKLGKIIFDENYLWILATADTIEGAVINVNPSTGEAMMWTGLIGNNPADIYFDNSYYWVSSAGHGNVSRFYLQDDRVCSELNSNNTPVSCNDNSDCSNNFLGTCIFDIPQRYGEFEVSTDQSHISNSPSNMISDGNNLWINNSWIDSANNSYYELVKMSMADPNQIKNYNFTLTPTGLVYDGTYLWISSSTGILDKIYSGSGYGSTNLSGTLALQNNNSSVSQNGSIDIKGSGKFGNNITVSGDIISLSNVWGNDINTIGDGTTLLVPGTHYCLDGYYITNIVDDVSGGITQIECRQL